MQYHNDLKDREVVMVSKMDMMKAHDQFFWLMWCIRGWCHDDIVIRSLTNIKYSLLVMLCHTYGIFCERCLISICSAEDHHDSILFVFSQKKKNYDYSSNMSHCLNLCFFFNFCTTQIGVKCECWFQVGFTNEGKLLALDLEIYNNAGNSLDLSLAVLDRAMFHSDNVYEIPNVRIRGRVCFTNIPSNTAFRGFGGPQGMLVAENWVQRIAVELKKNPEDIRVNYLLPCLLLSIICWVAFSCSWLSPFMSNCSLQEINFQSEGSVLHYGQELQHCNLARLWSELKSSCDFSTARSEVDEFNKQNRWKKRGVAMVPTKFGISFTLKFMNQVWFHIDFW